MAAAAAAGETTAAVATADYNGGVCGERQKADGRQTPCAYPHPDPPRSVRDSPNR